MLTHLILCWITYPISEHDEAVPAPQQKCLSAWVAAEQTKPCIGLSVRTFIELRQPFPWQQAYRRYDLGLIVSRKTVFSERFAEEFLSLD